MPLPTRVEEPGFMPAFPSSNTLPRPGGRVLSLSKGPVHHRRSLTNATSFFIYDYANQSAPMTIEQGATTNSLYLRSGGNIGIGTSAPASKLTVAGVVESTTGGINFPDGSIQIKAAVGGTAGGGTVTSITAGAGLLGNPNPITVSGTIQANFTSAGGDNGTASTVSRGDHVHDARYIQLAPQSFTYSNSSMQGKYAFSEFGVYTSGGSSFPFSGIGTVTADGSRNVTSGTITEYYTDGTHCTSNVTGSYSVSNSGAGSITLSSPGCSSSSVTYSVNMTQQGASAVFTESDGVNWVSGTAIRQ